MSVGGSCDLVDSFDCVLVIIDRGFNRGGGGGIPNAGDATGDALSEWLELPVAPPQTPQFKVPQRVQYCVSLKVYELKASSLSSGGCFPLRRSTRKLLAEKEDGLAEASLPSLMKRLGLACRVHSIKSTPIRNMSSSNSASAGLKSSPFTQAVVASMRKLYPEALADKSFDNTGREDHPLLRNIGS